ncbi:3-hydroxyacyl-CoA dehydrogenase [Desulfonema ishimotonii]|uniref:3-hydroxyacyl-CoA dehydrogenase n=1 Tax=Desulfonema ishimotonii TaxID=45657 RepID=A0A401FTD5_9BACT|nr:3-hydroxyacyl-CoA dehydrogenase [Desulfonema ishimotonii]GBC60232.1 3-hydroxyacyl-CoA dehydrogenase [Desulfonema ishimotonii]
MDITGMTAIVTGGASGLGEACVRRFINDGAKAAILDFDETRGRQIASELGDAAIFCRTDVADEQSVQEAIRNTVTLLGNIRIVVNCAGIAPPKKVFGKNGPMPIEDFDRVVRVNLIGTMNVIRLAAREMIGNAPNEDGERGVVINTASIAAFEGQIGQTAYAASKAGVVGMTLPLAREFADYGIRVVTIAPGLFETPMLAALPEKAKAALTEMIPFPRRLGRSPEYARLAKHIIENPLLNGETIRLDSAIRMAAR